MKKIFYFLICLILFTSCDNFVLRKDKSEKVVFDTSIEEGKYDIYVYELGYSDVQKEKLISIFKFGEFLKAEQDKKNNNLNFSLPKNFYDDIISFVNREGIGIEKSFFRLVSLIDEKDKEIINETIKNIRTPKDAGELQIYLNKQYYYLLSLLNKKDIYSGDIYYTEFDKKNLISEYLKDKEELRKIFLIKKKSFLVILNNRNQLNDYKNDMIYLKNYEKDFVRRILKDEENLYSPIILLKSNNYKGYTVKNNKVILFENSGKLELNYFIGYNFNTKIIKIKNFNEIISEKSHKQIEISNLLNRKKYIPKRPLEVDLFGGKK